MADRERIFTFIREVYGENAKYRIPERWQWQFVDNPFSPLRGTDQLPVFIAVDPAGRVVGQTCTMYEPLASGEAEHTVGWSVDTFLLPECRGKGVGFELLKASLDSNPLYLSLRMSDRRRVIGRSQGMEELSPVTTYVRSLYPQPEVVRRAAARLSRPFGAVVEALRLDWAAASAMGVLRSAREHWRWLRRDRQIIIHPIDGFGAEADELWEHLAPKFGALVRRDRTYLNWKYREQPHMRYQCFMARRGREWCGHVVLRKCRPPEPNYGIIADVFADPDDAALLRTLWSFGVRELRKQGMRSVWATTSHPQYASAAQFCGFRPTAEAVPMFRAADSAMDTSLPRQPGEWLLGMGDHDSDQFPLTLAWGGHS